MTEQTLPFDRVTFSPELAQQRKEEGMSRAILKNYKERSELLEIARIQARLHARIYKTVSADDIREYMISFYPDRIDEYSKIAGHVFHEGAEWHCIGSEPSKIPSRHKNPNRIWQWKGNVECR